MAQGIVCIWKSTMLPWTTYVMKSGKRRNTHNRWKIATLKCKNKKGLNRGRQFLMMGVDGSGKCPVEGTATVSVRTSDIATRMLVTFHLGKYGTISCSQQF
jgi:hypothetical protein